MAQSGSVKPPLAAPDLWIVVDATTSNKKVVAIFEDW